MIETIAPVTSQPLFAVGLTVTAYAAADALWRRAGQTALLNPVLVATVLVAGFVLLAGLSYDTYIAQAQPLDEALGLMVVLLAVPLCRRFGLIRRSGAPLVAALVVGSAIAITTALVLPTIVGLGDDLVATIAPKSATTAVAVEVAERLGGLPGLTAVIVIMTGIFGAVAGPYILEVSGVRDDRAKGFALGVASHAIGTARAFQISETAGAFASLGMILNAVLTLALAPVVVGWIAGA